jgi:predicted phosphodiesterase
MGASGALLLLLIVLGGGAAAFNTPGNFDFAILGDHTGEAVEGVWEEAWRETNLDHPAFIVTVGDTIQGLNDRTVETEWEEAEAVLAPYRRYQIFFTPGNHDVWSTASAEAYVEHTKHPLHYGFDYQQTHFTVLNDSESDQIPAEELAFLEKDLAAHEKQPVKFIFSHRPAWILQVVLGNPAFPLHQLALRYGVKYVIAGHIHQMLHFELDGVTYLSMASSGGHLRESKSYERGWFFEHTLAKVRGNNVNFEIKELTPPYGQGRVTVPNDWGAAGLVRR